jgi:DNA-binding NarL/FixJ family response regulator
MAARQRGCPSLSANPVLTVLIVDDHPLVRAGLRELLRALDDEPLQVHEAGRGQAALELLAGGLQPDLLLLDIHLPDMNGLDLLERLGADHADLPVVVLSGSDDPGLMEEVFVRGASGFLHKSSLAEIVVPALQLVLAGGVYRAPPTQPIPRLEITGRQHEVLRRLLAGMTNKDIARELGVSELTVKSHVSAVLRAMGVRTRTQAVLAAPRFGYMPATDSR